MCYSNHVHSFHELVPACKHQLAAKLPFLCWQTILKVDLHLFLMRLIRLFIQLNYGIASLDFFDRLLGFALEQINGLQELAGSLHDHIVDFLQEHNDPSGSAVVLGARPQQADGVKHWVEALSGLVKLIRLKCFEMAAQRFQVCVNILRLFQRVASLLQQVLEGRIIAALGFL